LEFSTEQSTEQSTGSDVAETFDDSCNDAFESVADKSVQQNDEGDLEMSVAHLRSESERIGQLLTACSAPHIAKLTKAMAKIKTESNLIDAIVKFTAAVSSSQRRGGKIKVQPTSVSRRREGVSRGSRRIAAGRPPSHAATAAARIAKRSHKLSRNITANVAHAKSHGAGH
jgi:hypothetical protein